MINYKNSFILLLSGMILWTLSCSTTKPLQEEGVKLAISDFKIIHRDRELAAYQLKAKLTNNTKETIQLILPLAEAKLKLHDWHKPEFFTVLSNPEIGPTFIDQYYQDEEVIVKTSREVVAVGRGKSIDFVYHSNCAPENNMHAAFKGTSSLILHYEITPQKKRILAFKTSKGCNHTINNRATTRS